MLPAPRVILSAIVIMLAALAVSSAPALAEGCGDDLVAGLDRSAGEIMPIDAQASEAVGDGIMGTWTARQNPSNGSGLHCHTLIIHEQRSATEYAATVRTNAPAGWSVQFCDVRVTADAIHVNCDVIGANTPYNADNFSLTLNGERLVGTNIDDGGVTGDVIFCRMK